MTGESYHLKELERLTKELEKSESISRFATAKFKAIFNCSPDAIFIHDINTFNIIDINDETLKRFGYTKDEIKKLSINDLSHESMIHPTNKEWKQYVEDVYSGKTVTTDWISKTRFGKLIYHEIKIKMIYYNGQPRLLVVARDITKRKQLEIKLSRKCAECELQAICEYGKELVGT